MNMKNRALITLVICMYVTSIHAQSLSVNTDGSTADQSAILDVKSTGKGILIPRLTSVQRNGIALPATGLLVFQTGPDSIGFHYYDGSKWHLLGLSTELYWNKNTTYNTVYNTGNTKVGIGTDTAHAALHISTPSRVLFGKDTTGTGTKFIYNGDKAAVRFGGITVANLWDNDSTGYYSFGFGSNPKARGDYSFAGGDADSAIGLYSIALGVGNLANGITGAIAMGTNNKSTQGGMAFGTNNIVSGNTAFAAGYGNTSASFASTALGNTNTASGNYSLATGFLTKATGQGSFTTGNSNIASGQYSVSMGLQDTTVGDYSLSHGNNNKVSGNYSMGIGSGNKISGTFSAALGNLNQISSLNSFAWGTLSKVGGGNSMAGGLNCIAQSALGADVSLGYNNLSTGGFSVSLGSTDTASGSASIALNSNNAANGANSFASGYLNQANGNNSFVAGYGSKANNFTSASLGYQTIANGQYATVVGLLNDTLVGAFSGFPLTNSPLFIVGNGTNSVSRKNAMVVTNEGVTSFAMNPINGTSDGVVQVQAIASKDNLELYNNLGSNKWGINVISDLALYYNGILKGSFSAVSGVYTAASDARLKKDVVLLPENTLSKIKLLKPAAYHYIDNKKDDSFTMGFMAQDFYKLFPELTTYITNREGKKYLGINYNNVSVLSIKAIQIQQQQIDKLNDENENLKSRLQTVTSRLDQIEKILNR